VPGQKNHEEPDAGGQTFAPPKQPGTTPDPAADSKRKIIRIGLPTGPTDPPLSEKPPGPK